MRASIRREEKTRGRARRRPQWPASIVFVAPRLLNTRNSINQPLTFAADGGSGLSKSPRVSRPCRNDPPAGSTIFGTRRASSALAGVSAQKEIAYGLALQQGQSPSSLMLPTVLREVASLAKRHEIARLIVRRIVVAMRRRQNHPRRLERLQMLGLGPLERPSSSAPPSFGCLVPPAPVGKSKDRPVMRPAATLTASTSPPEADHGRELRPINRVKPAVLWPDRHGS